MTSACCADKAKPQKFNLVEKTFVYKPIIVIFLASFVAGFALHINGGISFGDAVMAFFLCFLSVLKFFNVGGFVDSFAKYDILANRFKFYAYSYPIIELTLACLYFSGKWPLFTNIAMVIIMVIGIVGIFKTILSGHKVQCACVGTGFSLPVGRVTLLENTAMGIMAAVNIIFML